MALVTVLVLALAGAAVRAEDRQGGPVSAGSEPDADARRTTCRARTRWNGSSRRCAASRPTSRRTRNDFDIETYYSFWLNDQANTRLYLKPKDEAKVPAEEVMRRVSEDMPEIIIGKPSFQFDDEPSGSTSFSLQLSGESTERLADISQEVAHRLSSVPGPRGRALRGRNRRGGGPGRREPRPGRPARTHDRAGRHDRRRGHARRPPAGTAHLRPGAHHAARVPRIGPPVGGRPGEGAGDAARRLAHRARRRRGFRRACRATARSSVSTA